MPKAVLQQRATTMFSGISGAVVASGEVEATSAPSLQLISDVIEVVDALPAELFDRHAAHRPCGLLDHLGAYGMLLGDVLGLPLVPWVLAEPVGKAAAKLQEEDRGQEEGGEEEGEACGSRCRSGGLGRAPPARTAGAAISRRD